MRSVDLSERARYSRTMAGNSTRLRQQRLHIRTHSSGAMFARTSTRYTSASWGRMYHLWDLSSTRSKCARKGVCRGQTQFRNQSHLCGEQQNIYELVWGHLLWEAGSAWTEWRHVRFTDATKLSIGTTSAAIPKIGTGKWTDQIHCLRQWFANVSIQTSSRVLATIQFKWVFRLSTDEFFGGDGDYHKPNQNARLAALCYIIYLSLDNTY